METKETEDKREMRKLKRGGCIEREDRFEETEDNRKIEA